VDQGKLGKLGYMLLGWETFFDSYNQNKNQNWAFVFFAGRFACRAELLRVC